MSFEDNKSFWEEFFQLYQENPCLWDIKCKDYRNKLKKNAAYENLINKSKEMFPDANKKFVIKKISSLRSSFRRQIRRINSSKRSGVGTEDVPEPTLWYFDLLSFLMDQEESRAAVSSIEGNNLDDQSQASETDAYTQHSDQDLDSSSVLSPEAPQSATPSSRNKRTLNCPTWTQKKNKFLDASIKVLETPQQDVLEPQEITFGKNTGQQLQDIAVGQKIIAQKLILDVLYHAKLGNLTRSSHISLGYQPPSYQSAPCVPQAQIFQNSCSRYTTSINSTFNEPSTSYTRQPDVPTFTTLTTPNQASANREVMEEFLVFPRQNN
ncbi:unnamed protein product [Acanthoscelides obtectus]|uniref:MADF domain-containing protein n=1 Tax=Acanthoscelides obtectus TaxID=200917 RepID=A0A9P0K6F3_ACAOB|nr:unnamed protein product [Acanthoscelides obtectus]CAK1662582.1 hypothetical protein AOBTE_LOCUS23222 [Acanthoscelides obtectus]